MLKSLLRAFTITQSGAPSNGFLPNALKTLFRLSRVIFLGVILTPKRSLKNSSSGVKVTPDIEELK